MNKKQWNEGLDHIDPDLVEKYVEQKGQIEQKQEKRQKKNAAGRKKLSGAWTRVGALAASLVLIVGASVLIYRNMFPDVPVWDDAHYSAEDIAGLFDVLKYEGATNAYTKVYVPDSKYLYVDKIPDAEYLRVYCNTEKRELDKKEFAKFINKRLPKISNALNSDVPQYEIREAHDEYHDYDYLYCEGLGEYFEEYYLRFFQYETYNWIDLFKNYKNKDKKITLGGIPIEIDQRLSDEEIIESLRPIKNKLNEIFNTSFSETEIVRVFWGSSAHGADIIHVFFYNNNSDNLNFTDLNLIDKDEASEYICITFDNHRNYDDDIVSDGILNQSHITYRSFRKNVKYYPVIANAKRISLEAAEELLYNGYVFGGHSCPLCMAAQDKISFEGYDFVDIEYVFGRAPKTYDLTIGIPFYAFYKKIGTSAWGYEIYAKTYVPAIEVKGLKEYFQRQESEHAKKDAGEDAMG